MPIIRQSIDVPFAVGIDEKSDRKLTLKVLSSQNCRQDKTGALSQRYGTNCIGAYNAYLNANVAPTIAPAELLTTRGSELVRIGGNQLATYGVVGSADHMFRDFRPEALLYRTPLASSGALNVNVDVAYSGGYACAISTNYTQSSGSIAFTLAVTVTNLDTGAAVWSQYVIATGANIGMGRVCATSDGSFIVVYLDGTSLKGIDLPVSTMAWGTLTVLKNSVAASSGFDIDPASTGGGFFLVHENTGLGTTGVRIERFTSVFASAVADTAVSSDTGILAIACAAASGGPIFVAWGNHPGNYLLKQRAHSQSTLTAAYSAVTVVDDASMQIANIGIGVKSSTDALLAYTIKDTGSAPTGGWYSVQWVTITSAGGGAAGTLVRWMFLESRPFYDATLGRYYFAATDTTFVSTNYTSSPGSIFLIDPATASSTFYPDTCRLVGQAAMQQTQYGLRSGPSRVSSPSTGRYLFGFSTGAPGTDVQTAAVLMDVRMAATKPTAAEIDGKLVVSGGSPSLYDGDSVAELGFAYAPNANFGSANSTSGSGSLTVGGVYRYLFCYEWHAADGSIMRSIPSRADAPLSNTAGDDTMTVKVPYLDLTNKHIAQSASRPVKLGVYRTTANAATYYETIGTGISAEEFNRLGQSTPRATLTDTNSDAAIRVRNVLYTQQGLPASVMPPSAAIVAVVGRRVWLAGTDDDTVWYSDKVLPGQCPSFSFDFVLDPFAGGRIQAIGYLGEQNVILFKADSIWMVRGDGPNSTNTDGDFTEPERVTAEVGCTEPRSVLSTTDGIYFQSRAGICLLKRDLSIDYIGKEVETTLGSAAITSAVLVSDLNEVRFTIEGSTTVLVRDQYHQTWATNTMASTPVSACYWNGKWTYIDTNGRVWQDTYTAWHDTINSVSTYANASFQVGFLKLDGVQGYQRCWDVLLLGDRMTSHGLTVDIYNDYETTADQTKTWTSSEVDAWSVWQPRVHLKTQKVQSLSVKVTTTPTSGTLGNGRGFVMQGLRLEAGIMGRGNRIPGTRTG